MSERSEPGIPASSERGPSGPATQSPRAESMSERSEPGIPASSERGPSDRAAIEIHIDREKCMGSGNCSYWAPGVFDLDDEGVAYVIDIGGAPEDKILLAAQGCPTQAITVVRDGEKIAGP